MEYPFNEEQLKVRDRIRSFVAEEVAPNSERMDVEQSSALPIVRKLAELGYASCTIPKKYGGSGMDFTSYCIIVEEIARQDPAVAACVAIQSLGLGPLLVGGSEEQKRKYLPRVATQETPVCFALTEENAGSDPAGMETTATRDGDFWVLNGQKRYISMGDEAQVAAVVCRTDPDAGSHGISAFVVDRAESPWEVVKYEDKTGIRACHAAVLRFDEVRVPAANMIGKEGTGLRLALSSLDSGRCGVAAIAVGTAEGAVEEAARHLNTRVQFGKPLAARQGLQFMLSDMGTRTEAAKLMVLNAARLSDAGESFDVQAAEAKLFAARSAVQTVLESVQIHGGEGLVHGHKIERLFRDSKYLEIIEGTNQVQQMVISKALLRG